ncbi:hypothetical protein L4X63_20425 [Geomonas sp. Red32]|uniref:hypothetical protein n=1 Tax=Geomonas sp. Red32 TaxID=2912856 RepID=UPI00202CB100|nr:hypothetical protein [Geomonas sp. Red32]MCM0083952.1 hypothetical protein [Geomonas sp. Red32]
MGVVNEFTLRQNHETAMQLSEALHFMGGLVVCLPNKKGLNKPCGRNFMTILEAETNGLWSVMHCLSKVAENLSLEFEEAAEWVKERCPELATPDGDDLTEEEIRHEAA